LLIYSKQIQFTDTFIKLLNLKMSAGADHYDETN